MDTAASAEMWGFIRRTPDPDSQTEIIYSDSQIEGSDPICGGLWSVGGGSPALQEDSTSRNKEERGSGDQGEEKRRKNRLKSKMDGRDET